ncbi:MAG: diguanylate cyclase [Aestuariibacter sp.]
MQLEQPTILIVDDDKHGRKLLNDLLKSDAKIVLAKNGQQALELVNKCNPTVILMDILMPDINGFQVLEKLKANERTKNIAILFITALDNHKDEAKGLRMGACDYIHKPFHPDIVVARVKTHLELAKHRKMLEKLVNFDALTAIPNRRHLEQKLESEWTNSVRTGQSIAIAMLDVDHFKIYNDHYGHAAGDQVLKRIANVLEVQLHRPRDVIARYGGEEFCIVLPDTDIEGAAFVMDKCCKAVRDLNIENINSSASNVVSISVGCSVVEAKQSILCDDARLFADNLLYKAKENGRDQVQIAFFEP